MVFGAENSMRVCDLWKLGCNCDRYDILCVLGHISKHSGTSLNNRPYEVVWGASPAKSFLHGQCWERLYPSVIPQKTFWQTTDLIPYNSASEINHPFNCNLSHWGGLPPSLRWIVAIVFIANLLWHRTLEQDLLSGLGRLHLWEES